MLKLLVMSDIHLVQHGRLSIGLDTEARFRCAIRHINCHNSDADLCILAGDLADLGEPEAYERLENELRQLKVPVQLTIGNHDSRDNFAARFPDRINPDTGRVDQRIDIQGHRIVILDTVADGTHAGEISPAQVNWLKAQVAEAMDRPLIVIMHHNFTALWVSTDAIRLRNGADIVGALNGHPDVRHVICGHVHLSATGVCRGIPFTTLSGCHFRIEPRMSRPDREVRCYEGPSQYLSVISDHSSTVIRFENFIDRHIFLPPELFE